jgi:hypothetical protein
MKIVIELREDGKVYVTGPLDKRELCIAMIEEAKNAVNSHEKRTIVMPTIRDLKLIK